MNDDLNKLIEDEENDNISADEAGDHSASGSSPSVTSDDDVMQEMEEVIGNEPKPGKPFSIADEIEKDEMERRGIDPKDMGIDE